MTNLTSLSALFKKFVWLLPFIFAIILFLILIVIRNQPKKTQLPPLPQPSIQPISKTTSSFDAKDLTPPANYPNELPVYALSQSEDLTQRAGDIATKLGFTQPPEKTKDVDLGEGLSYYQKNLVLASAIDVLNVYKDGLTLAKSGLKNNDQKMDSEALKKVASDFLANIGFGANIENGKTSYFKVTQHDTLEVTDQNQASYINFAFENKTNSYPIITSKFKNNISLDFSGNVLQLTLRSFKLEQAGQNYPVISFKNALDNLLAGKGTIINVEEPNYSTSPKLSLSLKNAYLGYFVAPGENQLVQPVWVFEGLDTKSQPTTKATYVVPAIKNF